MVESFVRSCGRTLRARFFLVGIALLLLNVVWIAGLEERVYWPDEVWYLGYAHSLIEGRPYADPTHRPPGTSYLFAAVSVLWDSWLGVRLANVLIGSLTAVVLFSVAGSVYRSGRVGIVAGAVCLGYPFFVFLRGFALSETLAIFFLATFSWALLRADEVDSNVAWLAAGLLAGVANLVRPVLLLMPIVLPALLWTTGRYRCRRTAVVAGLFGAGWALVIGLWLLRNHYVTGTWQLTSQAACEFYKGLAAAPGQNPSTFGTPGTAEGCRMAAAEFARTEFPRLVWHKAYNAVRFWSPDLDHVTSGYSHRWMQRTSYAVLLALYSMAFLGWHRADHHRRVLVAGVIVAYWLFHVVAVVKFRYRIPVDVLLIVFAAGGLVGGATRMRRWFPGLRRQ